MSRERQDKAAVEGTRIFYQESIVQAAIDAGTYCEGLEPLTQLDLMVAKIKEYEAIPDDVVLFAARLSGTPEPIGGTRSGHIAQALAMVTGSRVDFVDGRNADAVKLLLRATREIMAICTN